jgi:hypothetical protein
VCSGRTRAPQAPGRPGADGEIDMDPARPLVLTREEHALLGELVEIMGLTEAILAETADRFDAAAAAKIRGLTAKPQAEVWARAVRSKARDPQILGQIDAAEKEIGEVAEERNDFIHALFEGDYVEAGYVEPGYQTTSATRSKTGRKRPVSDLAAIRHRAAALSCLVKQIADAI